MPKVRNTSVHAIEFEVSPWQTKKRKYDQVQGSSADRPVNEDSSRQNVIQASSTLALEPQHASEQFAHEKLLHANGTGGKQRHFSEQHQPTGKSADLDSSLGIMNFLEDEPEVSPAIREAMQRLLQQTEDSDAAAPSTESLQHPIKLEGTACLAWLADGQMIGDLHSLYGSQAVSIRGREVISERECTGDAEWKLLHVTLQRSSSCRQVSLLVEKTGCDAAMLSAPSQLHGSEVGLLGEATVQSDPSIHLSFACEELLSDAAAERKLAARHPELCGQGAIVNIGAFTCSGSGLELLDQPRQAQHELYDSDLDG